MLPHIPGYEMIQRLGGGPLTTVFSARRQDDDTLCAVKVLRSDWEDLPTALKLIQREARAGYIVQHPRLVRVLDAHVTRPPYFLVMELLPGESLRRRLRRDGPLDVATAVTIARQAAEGLAALHRANFLHGDVKPDNIRLLDDDSAKLIDLGFAHRPGENAHLVRKGYIVGTVDYLAPELCACEEDGDQSADIYSLGVTLYEMLAGKLPYPTGSIIQTMRRHCHETPADIRRCVEWIPFALADLVDRLLARRAEDRPSAMALVPQFMLLENTALERRKSA